MEERRELRPGREEMNGPRVQLDEEWDNGLDGEEFAFFILELESLSAMSLPSPISTHTHTHTYSLPFMKYKVSLYFNFFFFYIIFFLLYTLRNFILGQFFFSVS
jgi:hypothetical protein